MMLSFLAQDPLKNILKSHEEDDRNCRLQDVFSESTKAPQEDEARTKDVISLLHRTGLPPASLGPPKQLPSPDAIFQNLMVSDAKFNAHANGISSLAYALISIVDLNLRRPESSSRQEPQYFDLYPLYGGETADFDKVRLKDGRGMLSPDCFYDDRLTFLPRATSVLLVLFNRNHNYLAQRLFLQKENRTEIVASTDGSLAEILLHQDDEIFKMARLINCGHFRNILLEDVLKPLMGLSPVGPTHNFDLLNIFNAEGLPPIGGGFDKDHVEATLLYDWSDIISDKDAQQISDKMSAILDDDEGADINRMTPRDFDSIVSDHELSLNTRKRDRDCAGLPRGHDARFNDFDLAEILHDATEAPARATGTGIPSCQRFVQIKAIESARESKVCSFNDYRKFLGLKSLKSFTEWNGSLAEAAKSLYTSIDNLELHVGLLLEETVDTNKDAGFRLGYTKTYGLLVDIVSRIRSDPALTKDFTSMNLTPWGLLDCKSRPVNGSFGASLPKLLQRTLPHHYIYNSIYGLFPLTVPSHTTERLKKALSGPNFPDNYVAIKYDLGRPIAPKVHQLVTQEAISHVFNRPSSFPSPYNDRLSALTRGQYGYFLGFDDEERHDQDQMMSLHALIPDSGALKRYAEYFSNMTNECIRENTKENGELDVARDVVNAVCTRWVSETLLEFPLKQTVQNGEDDTVQEPTILTRYFWNPFWILYCKFLLITMHIWNPLWARLSKFKVVRQAAAALSPVMKVQKQTHAPALHIAELSDRFASIYAFLFQNVDPGDAWELRETALRTSTILSEHIRQKLPTLGVISDQSYIGFLKDTAGDIKATVSRILEEFTTGTTLPAQTAQTFLSSVVNANASIPPSEGLASQERVIANVLGLAVVASAKYAKVCTQAINFYLQDNYAPELQRIIELAQKDDANSKRLLLGYIKEAYRLDHPLGLWRHTRASGTIEIPQGNGLPSISVRDGEMIYADFNEALRNPPNVDPNRPKVPGLQGFGLHKCPGFSFVDETMPEIFRAVFRLKNIHRVPGRRGNLIRFSAHSELYNGSSALFLNAESELSAGAVSNATVFKLGPYPQSLVVKHNGAPAADKSRKTVDRPIVRKRKNWNIQHGKTTESLRTKMDISLITLVIFWILFTIFNLIMSLFHSNPPSPARPQPPPPPSSTVPNCPLPITVINPWEPITMNAGPTGELIPIDYTLDLPVGHRLSFVDIDAKDMRVKLWLDGNLLGLTPEVKLNKSENCGEDFAACLNQAFSGGDIVLPKGKHTVRIEWAGVETPGPDGKIDWGKEGGRRLGWHRVSCGV